MNFEFSKEQELLRTQARAFLAAHCDTTVVRKILESSSTFDRSLWNQVAELGWLATVIPEQYGGLSLTYDELAVIAEELGRVLAPIPFSSSVYFMIEALLLAGTEEQKQRWLPKLATGEIIGTVAFAEQPGRPSPRSLKTRVEQGNLFGSKVSVPDGAVADLAIVVTTSDQGDGASLYLVELANTDRTSVPSIDPSRNYANIMFENVPGDLIGTEGKGWSLMDRLLNRAAVLFAWEQVGGAQAALAQAIEYSKERFAFGRPIGSFQAIKHKLAQAYVNNTLARSNCYYGTWALTTDSYELPLAAATCRVSASQAYHFVSKENIQTHGGMGFTWEFDCHLYYRRARALASVLGSEMWWQARLMNAYDQRNKLEVEV